MKNILFLVTKSENGGAQKWTKEQIEICSKDFRCFLATDQDGWLSKNVDVKDKFLNNLIHKRFSLAYLLELNKFIKNNEIDLIIASSANAGIYSRLIKFLNIEIKVVYVSHGWSSIYNGGKLAFIYTFIEKQLSKMTDSILCISQKDHHNAKNIIGISEDKLKLISNKIYPIINNDCRKINSEKVKVLTVARLVSPKRIDLLIEATRDLDVELHIVGDGILRENLEMIKHHNVIFHGEIDGFLDFAKYDIFALISDSEGLPISALEAMSCGLPLILSDVGGCYELINNNGVLVNSEYQNIQNAIITCINNKVFFSKKSFELFKNQFDLTTSQNEYKQYYQNFTIGDNK